MTVNDDLSFKEILSIAAVRGNFLLDKFHPKHKKNDRRAKILVKLGYMRNHGTEGKIRYYAITEDGLKKLSRLK